MASSFDMNLSTDAYKSLIMTLATDIVWKDTAAANVYEANLSPYESEIFIAANRGLLTWDIVDYFPKEIFLKLGYDLANAETFATNKKNIPEGIRSLAISEYQNALKSKNPYTGYYQYNIPVLIDDVLTDNYVTIYEEKNNYYRMLMGLPDIDDNDYVYNTKNTKWSMTTPIHEMNLSDRLDIEESGYLDELIEQYPEKKYLKYIGSKNIDFFTSRTAGRYEILWMKSIESSSTIKNDFKVYYEYNRNMVLNVYYSDAFRKDNTYYESFLAMSILLMTIHIMNSQYLQKDITREFYDTDSIRAVYESYGVPFYSEIPLEYHKRIVKSINRLISYKGSTQVVLELFDIFNLGNMELFEYYLMKTHRFDEHNNPIFVYDMDINGEYILDEDGNKILSEDQSSAYDLKFAKSKVGEDTSLQLTNENNYVEYDNIIITDPYWQQDTDLETKLDSESFNYNESKYLGIQSVFNLMKITYETAYGLKAIIDNKDITDRIDLSAGGSDGTLFDYIIYLGALYCKKKGWEGVISSDAATVSTYLGYDFKENLETLKRQSYYDKYIAPDNQLIKMLNKMNIQNITNVNSVIKNINELREYLGDKIISAKDHDEFYAYRDLYNTLLTSKFVEDVFGISEGESTTFAKVLSETSSSLYNRYLLIDDYEYEIENIVLMLEDAIPTLENLSFIVGMDTSDLIDSLFKIITFFKSAKAELVGLNIVYQLSTRLTAFIKLLDLLYRIKNKFSKIDDDIVLLDLMQYIRDYNSMYRDMMYILKDEFVNQNIKNKYRDHINYISDILKIGMSKTIAKFSSDIFTIDEITTIVNNMIVFVEKLSNYDDTLFFEKFINLLIKSTDNKSNNFHMIDSLRDVTPEANVKYLLTLIDKIRSIYFGNKYNDLSLLKNDVFGDDRIVIKEYNRYKSLFSELSDALLEIPNTYKYNDDLTLILDTILSKIFTKRYRYNTIMLNDRLYEIV